MKAYAIKDTKGNLMHDVMGRICFTTLKRANEVNGEWKGTVVEVEIKIEK